MLSGLDHEPAARAEGLRALAQKLTPGQLDEHASALIAKGDLSLLLNLGRLQLLVEPCGETRLGTALALLEGSCVSDDSPARRLLDFLPDNVEVREEFRPMLSGHLDRMLDLLCSDHVSWPAGREALGMLVACADPRYKGLSSTDISIAFDIFIFADDDEDDWTALPVARSQERWRQARAVLSGMPEDMPAEEQVKRMNLAILSPKKDIDVLTMYNEYREGTIASMVSELADSIGAVALSHSLVRAVQRAPPPPRAAAALLTPADDRGTAARPKIIKLPNGKRAADDSHAMPFDWSGVNVLDEETPPTLAVSVDTASSSAATPITPAPTPVPAANAALRAARDERERRASQGGVVPPRSGHGAAPSGSGSVATLANLRVSEEQEDRCAICGGIGVQGFNELVRCGFGDGCCIQEHGDAPRRACWHAACEPKLHGKQGQRVVCARHEKDARLRLDVGASGQA